MTSNDDASAPISTPAARVAQDESRERAPNAKRHFDSPEMLVADVSVTDADKLALLRDWDLELSNRLKAEEEGMSASDPMSERREARLADESARVKTLLTDLAGRLDESG